MNHPEFTDPRAKWIYATLSEALEPNHLEVIDQGWQHIGHSEEGAGHFLVRIGSPVFADQSLINCHRLVYRALGDRVGRDIHALQLDILR
jgi:BolA protein